MTRPIGGTGGIECGAPPLSAIVQVVLLVCAAATHAVDFGTRPNETVLRYQAWAEQLEVMDCSEAAAPSACREVFYADRAVGPTPEQFAALTAEIIAHFDDLVPHLVHLLESDTLPYGLEYLLRFSGRYRAELLMPLASYAREHPSVAGDMLVQLMALDPRKNFRWVGSFTAERPRSRAVLALYRRLIVAALVPSNPDPRLIDNALRVDPSILSDEPSGVVVPAVKRRLAENPADAEVLALMDLLGGVWTREPAKRADLLALAGDTPWRRMALVCGAMRTEPDTFALRLWIAALGGEWGEMAYSYAMNEGFRQGRGRGAFHAALSHLDPSAIDDPAFRNGLYRLLFDFGHARELTGTLRGARNESGGRRAGWVRWLRGAPVDGAERLKQRLELLQAAGADLVALYPELCAPRQRAYQEKLNESLIALLGSADTARAGEIIAAITANAQSYEVSLLSATLYDIISCKRYRRLWVTHTIPVFDQMGPAPFIELACYLPNLHGIAPGEQKEKVTAAAERYAKRHRKDPLVRMAVALYHYRIGGFAAAHLAEALEWMADEIEPGTPAWEAADRLLYGWLIERIEADDKQAAAADVDAALSRIRPGESLSTYVIELKKRIARYEPFIFSF